MLDRERLTVDADREERVAAVGEHLHWHAAVNPSIDVDSTISASACTRAAASRSATR